MSDTNNTDNIVPINPDDKPAESSAELVYWRSDAPGLLREQAWPTYIDYHYDMHSQKDMGQMLGLLAPLGYRIAVVLPFRYGFLWLKSGVQVVFEREVHLTPSEDFMGGQITGRKTLSLPKALVTLLDPIDD